MAKGTRGHIIGRPRINVGLCAVDGCEEAAKCRGWCNRHYARWLRTGDPTITLVRQVGDHVRCAVEDCQNRGISQGLCSKHYARFKRTGDPLSFLSNHWTGIRCSTDGCDRQVSCLGLCKVHYERQRTGKPIQGPIRRRDSRPALERFQDKIDMNGPVAPNHPELGRCWIWLGARNGGGYGAFNANGKPCGAHVWAYLHFIGPYKRGLHLDHFACDNGAGGCCNPWHLRPVTNGENVRRALAHRRAVTPPKTHCNEGHELTPENTYVHVMVRCRTCAIAKQKAKAKKRQPKSCG